MSFTPLKQVLATPGNPAPVNGHGNGHTNGIYQTPAHGQNGFVQTPINGHHGIAQTPIQGQQAIFQTPGHGQHGPFTPSALVSRTMFKAPASFLNTPSRMFPGDIRVETGMLGEFSGGNKANHKLSPTADNFNPDGVRDTNNSDGGALVASPDTGSAEQQNLLTTGPVVVASQNGRSASPQIQAGEFTTDGHTTRVLKVIGVFGEVDGDQVDSVLKRQTEMGAVLRGARQKVREGSNIFLRFNDIRDAMDGYHFFKVDRQDWHVEFADPAALSQARGDAERLSKHEGQVYMVAKFPSSGGASRQKMEDTLRELLEKCGELHAFQKQLGTGIGTFKLIAEFCDIEAAKFAVQTLDKTTVKDIYVEVGHNKPDVQVTNNVNGLNTPAGPHGQDDRLVGSIARMGLDSAYSGSQVNGSGYSSGPTPSRQHMNAPMHHQVGTPHLVSDGPHFVGDGSYHGNPYATPLGQSLYTPSSYRNAYRGTVGHHPPTFDGYLNPGPIHPGFVTCPPVPFAGWVGPGGYVRYGPLMNTPTRHRPRQQIAQSPYTAGGGAGNQAHNIVDLDKIRQGLDVRTTIMLRNIPNKIDQPLLKSIVDETSACKYDFMYLRIDFANECNVGYAFINFEDPIDIIDFVQARAGQRWNQYNSDKVAEVSYATIQGKDCLVQKFRNSSVMLEHPSFRPKLFYTIGHAKAGEEEKFPEPDNISKMRRSVENAEHVGLFAPRAGQHYRDEQRHRRSQFDRGTRLAEMEEQEYEFAHHMEAGGMSMACYDPYAVEAPYAAQYQPYPRTHGAYGPGPFN